MQILGQGRGFQRQRDFRSEREQRVLQVRRQVPAAVRHERALDFVLEQQRYHDGGAWHKGNAYHSLHLRGVMLFDFVGLMRQEPATPRLGQVMRAEVRADGMASSSARSGHQVEALG